MLHFEYDMIVFQYKNLKYIFAKWEVPYKLYKCSKKVIQQIRCIGTKLKIFFKWSVA